MRTRRQPISKAEPLIPLNNNNSSMTTLSNPLAFESKLLQIERSVGVGTVLAVDVENLPPEISLLKVLVKVLKCWFIEN